MASRAASTQGAHFKRTERVLLDSLSIADDSGWRQLDEERVNELEAAFFEGGFGQTALAGPSVVHVQGQPLFSAHDGGAVLFNGKHCVAALMRVREKWLQAVAGSPAPDWLTGPLLSVFEEGLFVSIYDFEEPYDPLRHQSMQALAHEEESNKLFHTTLEQKARLASAYYERCGKDWSAAQKALVQVLGPKKVSTIARWITLARDLSGEVLQHVTRLGLRDLPMKCVIGNKYLIGKGCDAKLRLSDPWAKV